MRRYCKLVLLRVERFKANHKILLVLEEIFVFYPLPTDCKYFKRNLWVMQNEEKKDARYDRAE